VQAYGAARRGPKARDRATDKMQPMHSAGKLLLSDRAATGRRGHRLCFRSLAVLREGWQVGRDP